MWYGRYSVSGSGDKVLILISYEKDLIQQSEEELVVIKGGAEGKE